MLTINNAHKMGVTAIAGTRNCKRIVSGGGEGQVSITQSDKILEGSWSSLKQKVDVNSPDMRKLHPLLLFFLLQCSEGVC